ncbi:hypothetical protein WK41_12975 [Burkholderia cepacia]|nr:hypothetical protein WK41_12975 [Burkholderia cepacia]RQT66705.1 hypothetical protein DF043_00510 [Burkholderia cepacia]
MSDPRCRGFLLRRRCSGGGWRCNAVWLMPFATVDNGIVGALAHVDECLRACGGRLFAMNVEAMRI